MFNLKYILWQSLLALGFRVYAAQNLSGLTSPSHLTQRFVPRDVHWFSRQCEISGHAVKNSLIELKNIATYKKIYLLAAYTILLFKLPKCQIVQFDVMHWYINKETTSKYYFFLFWNVWQAMPARVTQLVHQWVNVHMTHSFKYIVLWRTEEDAHSSK